MQMNIRKIIYWERYANLDTHRSYLHNLNSCEIKAWKIKNKSGLNGIRTHDLCDTGTVLYQLSYQTNRELATLLVCYIPVDGKRCK